MLVNLGGAALRRSRAAMRIAQLVVARCERVELVEAGAELSTDRARRRRLRLDRDGGGGGAMSLLPRPARLALLAALDVALHSRARPVSSRALAARHDLPPRHLEGMLQAMVRAGVLRSVRGPSGGYELARERRRLSVGEIVRVALRADEAGGADGEERRLLALVVDPIFTEAERAALARLDTITLDELHARALAAGLAETQGAEGDFEI